MARQRSRVDWLKEGDRNMAFFHAQASTRKSQNRVKVLTNDAGVVLEDRDQIFHCINSFYTDLYSAQENINIEAVLGYVPTKVTMQMNERLCRPFEAGEVKKALFDMKPSKAPGADGFTAGFFQKHWNLVQDDVTTAVLAFLQGHHMPDIVNRTIIALIPKVKNPQNITQYHPISSCNVIYKLCSKVLANRLREVLDEIISEEQSAFVPGRLITDNVLTAYECVHSMKKKKKKTKKGRQGWCAVKIDMIKAYYRVEWASRRDAEVGLR